ncbi:UNVERIFIED_CONTAM: SAG-related sequence SRS45 [Hammondia hammondi]|eukprot:XP_008885540.1 SAG-related sequence SRS45 [Hammondia hammondi]
MKLNPESTSQVYSDATCSTEAQLTDLLNGATLGCPAEEGFVSGEQHATGVQAYRPDAPRHTNNPLLQVRADDRSGKKNHRTAPTAVAAASLSAAASLPAAKPRNAPPAPVKKECKIVATVEAATKHTTTPPQTTTGADVS